MRVCPVLPMLLSVLNQFGLVQWTLFQDDDVDFADLESSKETNFYSLQSRLIKNL